MPLQRFIPSSSDRYISNDKNQGAVKFGHLNAVVDYINETVVADGLQLEGDGPLSTTPRLVTDAAGNTSQLFLSTSYPSGFNNSILLNRTALTWERGHLGFTRGDVFAGTHVTFGGIYSGRSGSSLETSLFFNAQNPYDGLPARNSYLQDIVIFNTGRVGIGFPPISSGYKQAYAKFEIRGEGTTSATTTFLVKNSSGTDLFKIEDSGSIYGNGTQASSNFVLQKDSTNDLIIYSSATWGGLLTPPTSGGANTMINGRITGTHGGYGNVAMGLGTIQADGSAFNFNTAIGQGSFVRGTNSTAIGNEAKIATTTTLGYYCTAIGYQATTSTTNAVAIGNQNALLQIGGDFVPTARVHVKGLGSTSATTSLLVQNSSGNNSLKVQDNGSVVIGNSSVNYGETLLTLTSNQGSATLKVGSGTLYTYQSFVAVGGKLESDQNINAPFYYVNTNVRIITPALDWIGIADRLQTTNPGGSISAKFGTFGTTYANINASAQVEIASTTKGFLPPRMTTAEKTAIATPAAGLVVYDNTLNQLSYFNGTSWVNV